MAVRRAKRLYRLRLRGAEGLTLKLLLFLADGWGWDDIKPDCIKGLDRVTAVSLNGVTRYERAKEPLDSFVDDIAEHQHRMLLKKVPLTTMNPTSPETMGFVIGMLSRGTSLEHGSATRILTPIIKASCPEISDDTIAFLIPVFEVFYGMLDMRVTKMLERLSSATHEQVERGRRSFIVPKRKSCLLVRGVAGSRLHDPSAAHAHVRVVPNRASLSPALHGLVVLRWTQRENQYRQSYEQHPPCEAATPRGSVRKPQQTAYMHSPASPK